MFKAYLEQLYPLWVSELQRSITVCPWLPFVALATIDLVGHSREFEV